MAKTGILAAAAFLAAAATAQEAAMTVALDHAELIRLPAAAERVIVGNPALADVTVDSPRLLSIFGKAPGETNLIVLGAHEQILLSRALVVGRGGVAVHVPGKDGPAERNYACAAGHCQLLPAALAAAAPAPAAASAPPKPPAPAQ
jgi:hypothetical protein